MDTAERISECAAGGGPGGLGHECRAAASGAVYTYPMVDVGSAILAELRAIRRLLEDQRVLAALAMDCSRKRDDAA